MVVVEPIALQDAARADGVHKQKGEKASYATSNASGKVIGELYKSIAGLKAVEVNYRTANDSLNDFASGAIDYGVQDPIFALARCGRTGCGCWQSPPQSACMRSRISRRSPSRACRASSLRLVRRDRAGGDAAPDRRQAQRVVQRDASHQ